MSFRDNSGSYQNPNIDLNSPNSPFYEDEKSFSDVEIDESKKSKNQFLPSNHIYSNETFSPINFFDKWKKGLVTSFSSPPPLAPPSNSNLPLSSSSSYLVSNSSTKSILSSSSVSSLPSCSPPPIPSKNSSSTHPSSSSPLSTASTSSTTSQWRNTSLPLPPLPSSNSPSTSTSLWRNSSYDSIIQEDFLYGSLYKINIKSSRLYSFPCLHACISYLFNLKEEDPIIKLIKRYKFIKLYSSPNLSSEIKKDFNAKYSKTRAEINRHPYHLTSGNLFVPLEREENFIKIGLNTGTAYIFVPKNILR